MITRPTTTQLLDVVRKELTEKVAPAVTDPQVATSLHMIDHILGTLAVRADHELGWMAEEMAAIEAVGERVAASTRPGAAAVADALAEFRVRRAGGFHAAGSCARRSTSHPAARNARHDVPPGTAEPDHTHIDIAN